MRNKKTLGNSLRSYFSKPANVITVVFLIVLLLNRNRLFRDMFVKMFIDVFYDTDRDE